MDVRGCMNFDIYRKLWAEGDFSTVKTIQLAEGVLTRISQLPPNTDGRIEQIEAGNKLLAELRAALSSC